MSLPKYYNKYMNDDEKVEFIKILLQNKMYEVITGSTSYGLDNEFSDEDIKIVACLPKDWYFSLGDTFETIASFTPDIEIHTPKKVINLANNQNPTILEIFYTEERFIKTQTKYSKYLRDNRDLFLSSHCGDAFGGYANEQLHRIKASMDKLTESDKNKHLKSTLNRLINTFEKKYPSYNNQHIILNNIYMQDNGKQYADIGIHFDNIPLQELSGIISEMTNTIKTCNKSGHRNKKVPDKIFKHAMHLIRILLNGIHVLLYGTVNVYMYEHRQLLIDIRDEKYTWDEIYEIIDDLENQLSQAKLKTVLPPSTDFVKINNIYKEIMSEWMAS